MNIPVLIVALITLLAFFAHLIGGTKETAALAPKDDAETSGPLMAYWVQAMCAFQMLAVDLLAVSMVLFAIVFWDLGPGEPLILKLMSLLYLAWGLAWVAQVLWVKKANASLLRLPHWLVWFVCAALLFAGA